MQIQTHPSLVHAIITCKYQKDRIKNNPKKARHHFPHYKSMGVFFFDVQEQITP